MHTCIDADLESDFVLPDSNGTHGVAYDKDWAKSLESDLVALERTDMAEAEPDARVDNFD